MRRTVSGLVLIFILIASCRSIRVLESAYSIPNTSINSDLGLDSSIYHFITPYREKLDSQLNKKLAYNPQLLSKDKLNSSIGNWMAEAILEEAQKVFSKVDFCLLNRGGIRSIVNQGPVTVGEVYEVMPFENELVLRKLNTMAVDSLLLYLNQHWVGHPLAGLQVRKSKNEVELIENKQDFYWVVTSDYLAKGGDGMTFFGLAEESIDLRIKVRDALIQNLETVDTIKISGAVNYIEE